MKKRRQFPFSVLLRFSLIVIFSNLSACSAGTEQTTLPQQPTNSTHPTSASSPEAAPPTAVASATPVMVADLTADFDSEATLSDVDWRVHPTDENYFIGIQDGHLCMSGAGAENLEGNGMAAYPTLYGGGVPLTAFQSTQIRLMLASDHQGGYAETMVKIMPIHNDRSPRSLYCHIITGKDNHPALECGIQLGDQEIFKKSQEINFDEWHEIRIEIDPNTLDVTFRMDGTSYTAPSLDQDIWLTQEDGYLVQIWGGREIGTFATGCIDDLMVMRAEQSPTTEESLTATQTAENTHVVYNSSAVRATGASGIALSPDGSRIYLSAIGSQAVFVVDPSTKDIISVIDLNEGAFSGSKPFRLSITPDGGKLYTANVDNISVIDTATNHVIHMIDTQHWVHDIVFTPDGKTGFVDLGWNQIPVIDPSTDTIIQTIHLQNDDRTYALVVSNDGERLVGVSEASRGIRIYSIDVKTGSIVDQFLLDIRTTNQSIVSMSKDDQYLYLPSGIAGSFYGNPEAGVNKIYVVDLGQHTVAREINGLIGGPTSIRLSADGATGYVTTFSGTGVYTVDLTTDQVTGMEWSDELDILSRTDLRNSMVSPDGSQLFIVGLDANGILFADLETNTIGDALVLAEVTKSLWEISMSPDGKFVYITSQNILDLTGSILVIDAATNTVTKEIPLDRYPTSPVLSPDGKYLYFISNQNLMAMDLSTFEIVKSIQVDEQPSAYSGVVIFPAQDKAYVTNDQGRIVTIVDLVNEQIIGTIDVGWSPHMIVLSTDGKRAYVGRGQNAHDIGGLEVIDTTSETVIASLTPPQETQGGSGYHDLLALNPDNTKLYWVTNADKLNVVDTATNQILKTVPVGYLDSYFQSAGYHPSDIAFTSTGSLGYIPCGDSHDTAIFDAEMDEIIGYIYDTGLEPVTIIITPDDRYAYMPTKNGQNVMVLDLQNRSVVAEIPVP